MSMETSHTLSSHPSLPRAGTRGVWDHAIMPPRGRARPFARGSRLQCDQYGVFAVAMWAMNATVVILYYNMESVPACIIPCGAFQYVAGLPWRCDPHLWGGSVGVTCISGIVYLVGLVQLMWIRVYSCEVMSCSLVAHIPRGST